MVMMVDLSAFFAPRPSMMSHRRFNFLVAISVIEFVAMDLAETFVLIDVINFQVLCRMKQINRMKPLSSVTGRRLNSSSIDELCRIKTNVHISE